MGVIYHSKQDDNKNRKEAGGLQLSQHLSETGAAQSSATVKNVEKIAEKGRKTTDKTTQSPGADYA